MKSDIVFKWIRDIATYAILIWLGFQFSKVTFMFFGYMFRTYFNTN